MTLKLAPVSIAIVALGISSCGSSSESDIFRGALEGSQIDLSGEQITLTGKQLECGVKAELWDAPSGNTARLTEKGRRLQFSDDVRLNESDIGVPYTQVSGSFPVRVSELSNIRETDNGKKLADVKLGLVIAHECFAGPLPVMGVRQGKFALDAPVVFRFRGGGTEWSLDKLVH